MQSMPGPGLPSEIGGDEILRVIGTREGSAPPEAPVDVTLDGGHSNDIYQIRFGDGRSLVMKVARHAWGAERFEAARKASRMLRDQTGVVVPEPLLLPPAVDHRPRQAYWRIPDPTLARVWPDLSPRGRRSAMRSLGRLLVHVHKVRLPEWGGIAGGGPRGDCLAEVLARDIEDRMLPAIYGIHPEAAYPLERLLTLCGAVVPRVEREHPTLAHNDLHMGNVLCRVEGEEVTCVGLLDLDDAVAAPPASDVARFEVLHGPLFTQHLSPRWRVEVWRGYGRREDPFLVSFFRALHLANLGFQSALVGDDHHAAAVAQALKDEVARLERQA